MSIIIPTKPTADKATWLSTIHAVIDAIAGLVSEILFFTENALANPSFENVTDNIPDEWDLNLLTNGSSGVETADPADGQRGYWFTRLTGVSNGGGSLENKSYLTVSPGWYRLESWYKATAAVKSTIAVEWFDKGKSTISTATFEIEELTAWQYYWFSVNAPSTARFAKITITGGTTDVDVAGTATFDGLDWKRMDGYINDRDVVTLSTGTGQTVTVGSGEPAKVAYIEMTADSQASGDVSLTVYGWNGSAFVTNIIWLDTTVSDLEETPIPQTGHAKIPLNEKGEFQYDYSQTLSALATLTIIGYDV